MPATINRSFISLKEVFCGVYNNIYKKGLGLLWAKSERNKHNCVLLNTGLSNALTKTGFCTSLKWFLFPVSFTVEYKFGIAEFYLYMGFAADLLKNVVTRA